MYITCISVQLANICLSNLACGEFTEGKVDFLGAEKVKLLTFPRNHLAEFQLLLCSHECSPFASLFVKIWAYNTATYLNIFQGHHFTSTLKNNVALLKNKFTEISM